MLNPFPLVEGIEYGTAKERGPQPPRRVKPKKTVDESARQRGVNPVNPVNPVPVEAAPVSA